MRGEFADAGFPKHAQLLQFGLTAYSGKNLCGPGCASGNRGCPDAGGNKCAATVYGGIVENAVVVGEQIAVFRQTIMEVLVAVKEDRYCVITVSDSEWAGLGRYGLYIFV